MGTPYQMQRPWAGRQTGQRGMSLVEVLVAVVVLSIGVLGAVGMQVASLQATTDVRNQAVAASLVKELAEKMRGNHAVAIAAGNPYLVNTVLSRDSTIATPSPNCATASAGCTPTQIATWDMTEWQLRARDALPNPRVTICMDQTPFTGGVAEWACDNTGDVAVLKMAWNRVDTNNTLQLTSLAGTAPAPLMVVPLTAGSSE